MPRRAFSEKLNHLVHFELTRPHPRSGNVVSDSELFDQLDGEKTSSLFMGIYTREQILMALERFEIMPRIRSLGYVDPWVEFAPRSPFEHRLTIRCLCNGEDHLLGEVIVKEGRFMPKAHFIDGAKVDDLELIFIEWILMQRPCSSFEPDRRRMPGQNWPGLGVGRNVMKLLLWVCRQSERDGLLNFPEHYHNAFLYSEQFFFYDPKKQAEVLALFRDLTTLGLDLSEVSYAVYFDCVLDMNSDEPYNWVAQEQIWPVSDKIKRYFSADQYGAQVTEMLGRLKFGLNRERFEKKMKTADSIVW